MLAVWMASTCPHQTASEHEARMMIKGLELSLPLGQGLQLENSSFIPVVRRSLYILRCVKEMCPGMESCERFRKQDRSPLCSLNTLTGNVDLWTFP